MDETSGTINSQNYKRNRATDVILEVKPIDDKQPLNKLGLVDNRLFKGGNKIHAIMDPQTTHWYIKYEQGVLPEPLKQRFTGWAPLFKFVTNYFEKRNLRISEIID